MRTPWLLLILVGAVTLLGDQLVLKSGAVLKGSYLGGDTRSVRFAVGDQVKTFQTSDIRSIGFGDAQDGVSTSPDGSDHRSLLNQQVESRVFVLAASTNIIVNTEEALIPAKNKTIYRATVDSPIYVGQQLVIPKGTPCELATVPKPPQYMPWDLVLRLESITINGRRFSVDSDQYAIKTKFKSNVKVPFLLRNPLHLTLGT